MHKLLSMVLFAITMASCIACGLNTPPPLPPPRDSERPTAELIEHHEKATVMILDMGPEGSERRIPACTGIFVEPRVIMTAHHCVVTASMDPFTYRMIAEPATSGLVDITGRSLKYALLEDWDRDGVRLKNIRQGRTGTILLTDHNDDLALIQVPPEAASPYWVTISPRRLGLGDRVWSFGHPMGHVYSYGEAYVARTRRASHVEPGGDRNTYVVHIAGDQVQGASGSALYDREGGIVGIFVAMTDNRTGLSMAIHRTQILALMARLHKSGEKAGPNVVESNHGGTDKTGGAGTDH